MPKSASGVGKACWSWWRLPMVQMPPPDRASAFGSLLELVEAANISSAEGATSQ